MRFIKANIASWLATLLDFGVMALLHQLLKVATVSSSIIASICGGVLHFTLSRAFVFKAYNERPVIQLLKYIIVWTGNVFFTAWCVYILAEKLEVHYLLSKALSSVFVFAVFNYPMYKGFVFKTVR